MYQPRCFIEFKYGKYHLLGKIVIELFGKNSPKTCENFRSLCTGEKGIGETTKKLLWYKDSSVHKIIPNFILQMGDFSSCNGKGGESIYGGFFKDEDLSIQHDRRGLISMANIGRNTNGSQFFINFAPISDLNGKHVVFGQIIQGLKVLDKIEMIETWKNCPIIVLAVSNCGELIPQKKRILRFFSKCKFDLELKLEKNVKKYDEFDKKKVAELLNKDRIKKTCFTFNGHLRKGRGFFRYRNSKMLIKNVQTKVKRNNSPSQNKVSQSLNNRKNFVSKKSYSSKRFFLAKKKQLINKTISIISRLSGKLKDETSVKTSLNIN